MHELNKPEYRRVAAIFDGTTNSRPVVLSAVERNIESRIVADDRDGPKTALIILDDMFFLRGEKNIEFINEIYTFLIRGIFPYAAWEFCELYCLSENLRGDVKKIFTPVIHKELIRKTFTFDQKKFELLPDWRGLVPAGFYAEISPENLSAAIKRDDKIISKCSACFTGGGQTEIDVETTESYRKRGFATLACRAFIELSLSLGYTPNWSCWDFKKESSSLAKKLGFSELKNETVYSLKKPA